MSIKCDKFSTMPRETTCKKCNGSSAGEVMLPPVPITGPPTLGIVGDDGLITTKRHARGHCPSHRFMIDVDNRTVQCKACLKMFDPIEALVYFANWGERWRAERDGLNREIKAKTAVLEELERRLKNTKSRARKHGVAVPTAWEMLRSVPITPPAGGPK